MRPDSPIVIVPTGGLSKLAWAALPSLSARAFVLTPARPSGTSSRRHTFSIRCRGTRRARRRAQPSGLGAELQALGELYPSAVELRGKRATVQAVLEALAKSDLVHLAAHGSFRRDNPLFSTLRLADGPLTVYDLDHVQAAPRSMVLSACSAATALVMPGDSS